MGKSLKIDEERHKALRSVIRDEIVCTVIANAPVVYQRRRKGSNLGGDRLLRNAHNCTDRCEYMGKRRHYRKAFNSISASRLVRCAKETEKGRAFELAPFLSAKRFGL